MVTYKKEMSITKFAVKILQKFLVLLVMSICLDAAAWRIEKENVILPGSLLAKAGLKFAPY